MRTGAASTATRVTVSAAAVLALVIAISAGRAAPGTPPSALSASVTPPAGAARPLGLVARAGGSVNSLNSAGYAVSRRHVKFRYLRATFFVPYLNCALSKNADSADWVGLDGFVGKPDSVEQDGIEADCAAGHSSYHAWYAMYPRKRVTSKLVIRGGDSITASVYYNAADARFSLALRDNITGGHFRVHAACPSGVTCPRNSAEVISSAPTTGTAGNLQIKPLADYGAVSFAAISITDRAGQHGGLRAAHWAATRIAQTQQAAPFALIARPTPIQSAAFDTYWSRAR